MFARPEGSAGIEADGRPKDVYYGCGWFVRVVDRSGKINFWHTGLLDGTSTLLVRRSDGLSWAILFNIDKDRTGNKPLAGEIDPLVHGVADRIAKWPE